MLCQPEAAHTTPLSSSATAAQLKAYSTKLLLYHTADLDMAWSTHMEPTKPLHSPQPSATIQQSDQEWDQCCYSTVHLRLVKPIMLATGSDRCRRKHSER